MTDRLLRIGIVCYPTPGGSGVVATELGKTLASRGHQVHFITSGHPARLSAYHENVFLHTVETGQYQLFQQYTPYSLALAVKIREVADQYDLDLVHVHYAIPHAPSAFLAKEMLKPRRLPTITTLHGTDITLVGVMPSFYEVTRFSISVSDAITRRLSSRRRRIFARLMGGGSISLKGMPSSSVRLTTAQWAMPRAVKRTVQAASAGKRPTSLTGTA